MPRVKISSKDIERVLRKHGFQIIGQKGSHQQFKGIINGRKRRVTVLANKKNFRHPSKVVYSLLCDNFYNALKNDIFQLVKN